MLRYNVNFDEKDFFCKVILVYKGKGNRFDGVFESHLITICLKSE